MFVPQAAMAFGASLLGARLIRHFGIKRIYLIGLTANLVSMALLFWSQFAISNAPVAYGRLSLNSLDTDLLASVKLINKQPKSKITG